MPVLARYRAMLLAAARFAGTGLICSGIDPRRRNITNRLITALPQATTSGIQPLRFSIEPLTAT